eukprot:scaffold6514_cov102-Cylindrotheca_fusiformis.AAC.3
MTYGQTVMGAGTPLHRPSFQSAPVFLHFASFSHGVAGKLQRQLAEASVRLLQRQRKICETEEFKQLNVTEMITGGYCD